MALTWSVKNVADWQNVCEIEATHDDPLNGVKVGDKLWNPVTTALVWASITTGIGTITEANASEVFARIRLFETLHGQFLYRAEVDGVRPEGKDAYITREEVQAHVGLSTNASFKDESRASFIKRHVTRYLDDEVVAWNRAVERGELAKVAAS